MRTDCVHLFVLSLSGLDAAILDTEALASLGDDDRAAYRRIKAPARRVEFLKGRHARRLLVSRYLGTDPSRVRFAATDQGKPYVAAGDQGGRLHFNVSHSGDRFALALALDAGLGVDIERRDRSMMHNAADIARRHFHPREQQVLERAGDDSRLRHFFRMWTLKEAVLKAAGVGLNAPLASIDVAEPRALYDLALSVGESPLRLQARSLDDLEPGYQIAVATTARLHTLEVFFSL